MSTVKSYAEALADWEQTTYAPQSKKGGVDESRFTTSSDVTLRPTYGPKDGSADALEKLGLPGDYPFTRGVQPTMYRGRFWTMRQYAGFGTAEETNARFHQLLAAGQMGLSTAFDLPTQMGRDSDHPRASGEVGRVGNAPEAWGFHAYSSVSMRRLRLV